MKTKDDRELKSTSKKIFNKTNHIIKRISCIFLSMFILCLPLSFCVTVKAETADADIVMTDDASNDSTKQETKIQTRRRMSIRSSVSVLLRILSIMSMKTV